MKHHAVIRGRLLSAEELTEALATCTCSGCVAERLRDTLIGVRDETLTNLAGKDCSGPLTDHTRDTVSEIDAEIRLLWMPSASGMLH